MQKSHTILFQNCMTSSLSFSLLFCCVVRLHLLPKMKPWICSQELSFRIMLQTPLPRQPLYCIYWQICFRILSHPFQSVSICHHSKLSLYPFGKICYLPVGALLRKQCTSSPFSLSVENLSRQTKYAFRSTLKTYFPHRFLGRISVSIPPMWWG